MLKTIFIFRTWTPNVLQEESHAYFRNPSHLINSLDARKYDRVGTKSHVLDPQWAKKITKNSAKMGSNCRLNFFFFFERPIHVHAMAQ